MRIGQASRVTYKAPGIDKFSRPKDGSDRVLLRQCDESVADPEEERIACDDEGLHTALHKVRKCSIEITFAASLCNMQLKAKRARRHLHLVRIGLMTPVVGIDQDTED